jgi:hypothetical protein
VRRIPPRHYLSELVELSSIKAHVKPTCFQKSVTLVSRTFSGEGDLIGLSGPTNQDWEQMMGQTQIAVTARERFLQSVQKEMARFEQKEIEFLKRDQRERAAELKMPFPKEKHR